MNEFVIKVEGYTITIGHIHEDVIQDNLNLHDGNYVNKDVIIVNVIHVDDRIHLGYLDFYLFSPSFVITFQ